MSRRQHHVGSAYPRRAMNLSMGSYIPSSSTKRCWEKNTIGNQFVRSHRHYFSGLGRPSTNRDQMRAARAYSTIPLPRRSASSPVHLGFAPGSLNYGSRSTRIPMAHAPRTTRSSLASLYGMGGAGGYRGYGSRSYPNRGYGRTAWPSYPSPTRQGIPSASRYGYYHDLSDDDDEYESYRSDEGESYYRSARNPSYYDDFDDEEDDEFDHDYNLDDDDEDGFFESGSRLRSNLGYGGRRGW